MKKKLKTESTQPSKSASVAFHPDSLDSFMYNIPNLDFFSPAGVRCNLGSLMMVVKTAILDGCFAQYCIKEDVHWTLRTNPEEYDHQQGWIYLYHVLLGKMHLETYRHDERVAKSPKMIKIEPILDPKKITAYDYQFLTERLAMFTFDKVRENIKGWRDIGDAEHLIACVESMCKMLQGQDVVDQSNLVQYHFKQLSMAVQDHADENFKQFNHLYPTSMFSQLPRKGRNLVNVPRWRKDKKPHEIKLHAAREDFLA